ncbi:DEAD/DEAH box helicase [Roseicyclus persicicus]|uniref:DEAD/DEAH box helicase n=1 Tax=Roseicyclus persicicus TaxID=2650661 RepID=A0A7X6JY20_9RHOB|nr:DEAD/DEAH box helicase [Roseibacterium persicicum]NKX43949.1 DEAD/DEAH box helicase [Roseibacterium persicicum]
MIPTLATALAARGFDALTEVQEAVTAPHLAAADLLVSAQTGSGKTVGFGLAIAPTILGEEERFGPPAAPLALVVAPTRELALQVQRELAWLYEAAGARVVSCIGGMDPREERRALDRGAHVVVGTPGRLCDHINRGALVLADIRAIVLDEADEMLDLGFREDLEFMLGAAPAERRTLLFSATVPPAIEELARSFQRDAVRVTTINRGSQHADIAYQAVQVAPQDAEHAIINLLRFHDAPRAIVFGNTRATVSRLAARLANRGLAVVSLSGELSQDERSHALQAMRDGRARVCVATDVAARGIDLPNLDLVIHADLPTNTEALLHRSGRTGRAGRKGISALIVPDKASRKAERLLKWAKISAEWVHAPTPEQILALDETRLMADPLWSAPATEGEAAFAARLMAEHGPEAIATACLRLYRAGLSAPEDLNTAPAGGPRPERAPFGPAVWVDLSVGHAHRAEARWLLPLLCRAGGLDKAEIGKIRVEAETTAVEIAEAAAAGFFNRLGPSGELEDGIRATRRDGPPEPGGARPPKPARSPKPPRAPRAEARPAPAEAPAAPPPAQAVPPAATAPEAPAPVAEPTPAPDARPPRKPRHADKPQGKPAGAKPPYKARTGKPGDAPRAEGGKPFKPRPPQGQPDARADRASAADPSQRLGGRPGAKGGKPGKPGRPRPGGPRGGNAPPRRKG